MKIGYVGNKELKEIDEQSKILNKNGCWEIYFGHENEPDKKLLREIIEYAGEKDVLMVYSLGCLGIPIKKFINFFCELSKKNIDFISIKDGIDTTKKGGDEIFNVFIALENIERESKQAKGKKGLQSIKMRGINGGRPKKETTLIEKAISLYYKREFTIKEIESSTGVSKSTLYRELNKRKNRNP
ncbi:recombinase family protein [Falsibacillus pallidus]|uniref:recombinase family protein n=1 Tax=Falsibacillus pallidus TaxID=493781 RepID=UPI003D9931D6